MSTSIGKAKDQPAAAPATPPSDDPDAIRADIAQTRAEPGDSVHELAQRVDVKARAKDKVARSKTKPHR
jgi:hypothetical protein